MTDIQPVFRFAPSPNGELHLGHAYSALLNLKMARNADAKILLRIEDIDTERCTRELETQMLNDLEWIGFEWDEKPRRQSENFDVYRDTLAKLNALGLLYPSKMSRSEIKLAIASYGSDGQKWPFDPDGAPLYPGKEREIPFSARPAFETSLGTSILRLDMGKAIETCANALTWQETGAGPDGQTGTVTADANAWGDVILARRDTPTSYHLACTLDDAIQGVTHVVRGEDLFHATSVHRLLQNVLGLPELTYHHHRLILDADSRKLSKSNRDTSLRQLREAGISRKEVLSMIDLQF